MAYNNTAPQGQNYYPQQNNNPQTYVPNFSNHETETYQSEQPPATAYAANPTASYESNNLNSKMATYNEGTGASANPSNLQATPAATSDGKNKGSHIVGGSSTGAPALPSRVSRPEYSREHSGYNPATGTPYIPENRRKEQAQQQQQPRQAKEGSQASGSATKTSPFDDTADKIGEGIKGTFATIHGAGETLRGTANAAIDRAFNQPEGVAKNEAISSEGEYEARSGQFSRSTKQREGFNAGIRKA